MRAEVADAELAGAEALPAEQRQEVVLERADVRARLAEPERRLDDGGDAGRGHRLVVVGRARRHVDVRIEHFHWCCLPLPSVAEWGMFGVLVHFLTLFDAFHSPDRC